MSGIKSFSVSLEIRRLLAAQFAEFASRRRLATLVLQGHAMTIDSFPGRLLAMQVAAILLAVGVLPGCASSPPEPAFEPASINEVRFRDRAQFLVDPDVRVTAAVPSAEEAKALFGADLYGKEVQPIWVKVENHGDKTQYLVVSGTDPNHYSPLEAAYLAQGSSDAKDRERLATHFRAMAFRNPIPRDTAVSGFIYTNLDEGEKIVQVDLMAHESAKSFTFFVDVPGIRVDYKLLDLHSLHHASDARDLDLEQLRAALEKLPCCTTDKSGQGKGDPLNLVVIGDFDDVAAAFARRGWLPVEETHSTAVWKTIKSFLFGSSYRYSPVSPLYFSGRPQDMARQKPRRSIHERNHLRLWFTPMRYEGKPVFIGQISRDIGVHFTSRLWPPVTHQIDPDIDEARQSVIEDLLAAHTISKLGFVNGVGTATPTRPRKNLGGDPYFTDGLRAVILLEPGPISPGRIQSLGWETPGVFCLETDCANERSAGVAP